MLAIWFVNTLAYADDLLLLAPTWVIDVLHIESAKIDLLCINQKYVAMLF